MRVLAIRAKNLASLAGEVEVDFRSEPLASAGLFAITGATGSGKSTLLDALCLALYDNTPRLVRAPARGVELPDVRDATLSVRDPRNLLRRGTAEGWAEVEFLGNDARSYRARWAVRRARASAGGRLQPAEMTLVELPSEQPLGGRKEETKAAIEQRLGLSFEQFTRSVLLAQNEFFTFLKTDDNERAELLETLTGTDAFTTLSMRAFERAKTEQEALRRLEERLAGEQPLEAETRAALAAELAAAREQVASHETRKTQLEGHQRWYQELATRLNAEEEARARLARDEKTRQDAAPRRARLARIEAVQPARARVENVDRTRAALAKSRDAVTTGETALGTAVDTATRAETEREAARERLAAAEAVRAGAAPDLERAQRLDTQIEALAPGRDAARTAVREAQAAERKARRPIGDVELGTLAEQEAQLEAAVQALGAFDPEALVAERERLGTHRDALQKARELATKLAEGRGRETALREQLAAIETARGDAETALASLTERLPAATAARDQANRSLDAAKTACSDVVEGLRHSLVDGAPCPVCGATEHPYTERDPRLHAAFASLEQELRERQRELDALNTEHARQRAGVESADRQLEQRRGELERLGEQLADLRQAWERHSLADQWAGIPQTALDDHLDGQLELAREQLAEITRQEARYRQALTLRDAARDRREAAAARDERVRAETALGRLEDQLRVLEEERAGLWGGRPLREVEAELTTAVERAKRTEAERTTTAQHAANARTRAEEALAQARATLAERTTEAREAETALAGWLAEHNTRHGEEPALEPAGLRALLATSSEQITAERRHLETLDKAAQTAAAVLAEREQRRKTHELERPTPETLAEVETALGTARAALHQAGERRTTLEVQIAEDDARRARAEALASSLEAQRQTAELWSKLNVLIGSADGKKFRNYAQQITLDVLLGFANEHLEDLSRRYRLERVADTLALLVVDRDMGDERRSVHSLSGGETFLVSLALALALASLSSNRVRVESLFIDEGFGSLDADSLGVAMDALDKLHAMGRKVGVISHVQEMSERITTRIEVRKLAGGRSEVSVTG